MPRACRGARAEVGRCGLQRKYEAMSGPGLRLRGGNAEGTTSFAGIGDPDSLYAKLLRLSKDEDDRFDVYDCASRVARCIVAFYWLLLRFPLSFCWFMVRYNLLWEGKTVSAVTFACFPIYPFAAFTMVLAKRLLGLDGGYVPAKG